MEVAEQAGLADDEAREALESRRFKDAVDADWQRSVGMGVTSVPTFLAGDRVVMGPRLMRCWKSLLSGPGRSDGIEVEGARKANVWLFDHRPLLKA